MVDKSEPVVAVHLKIQEPTADVKEEFETNSEDLVSNFGNAARTCHYERHRFFETFQRDDGFDKFLSNLKIRSQSCEFKELCGSLILTQLIRGLKDSVLRERLLAKQDLSLDEAVVWCQEAESANRQAKCSVVTARATPEKLNQIKEETGKDVILLCIMNYCRIGWPADKMEAKIEARAFWPVKEELHIVNGILFRNDKIVIPLLLRKEMLERVHEGHLDIERSKRRAGDAIWWPSMGAEIEEVVAQCETCARHRAALPREPLAPHAAPALPWEVLTAAIFELKHLHYLLVVDYYSKFVEVVTLRNLLSTTIITRMKYMFCRFGIPRMIVTDNGPQFSSPDFKKFATQWEFVHDTSSPLYPRSNGLAERKIQIVKRLFSKAKDDGTEWQLALLNLRNTPIEGEPYSPAQLLMSRSLNTRLPVSQQMLVPRTT